MSLLFTNITIVITTSAQLPRPVRSGVTKKTLVARPVRSGTYPVSASRALARAQMRARPPPERRVQREREGQWGEGVHVGCCGDQSSEDGRSNGPTRGAEPTAICICSPTSSDTSRFHERARHRGEYDGPTEYDKPVEYNRSTDYDGSPNMTSRPDMTGRNDGPAEYDGPAEFAWSDEWYGPANIYEEKYVRPAVGT